MSEKVHKCNIKREAGYLYYIDSSGNVGRFLRGKKEKEIVCPNDGNFTKESGWMYYLDKNGDVSRCRMNSFKEYFSIQEEIIDEKNWIKGAIKRPGRCTPFPNPDCPKDSPQGRLAQRFKRGDLHQ